MKELVEFIVKSLVDYPEEVVVNEVEGTAATILELSVADSDMGRVIGRNGRVINSIRAILQVMAAKQGKRVTLEVLETENR
ncbi:MAG: KH domain-containing protein [Chloroflexi bacterium]|nr:MAG: KH domain-containing protein [Chloroflexota bacterium]